MSRRQSELPKPPYRPSPEGTFQCGYCNAKYEFPYEQAWCEREHENKPVPTARAEKVLLRLLAMVNPEHAEKAGEFADELLEAIRK